MDAKTIIAIVLVVFIVGAAVWLNIRPIRKPSITISPFLSVLKVWS